MINPDHEALFSSELWATALEKFGRAAQLTVRLFAANERPVLAPVHPTPLFQLFDESGYDPGLFAECARRCIAQTGTRPAVIVSELHGLAVAGTSLMLEGRIVGAAVGGYVFAAFSQVPEIQRLAREAGIKFERLWDIARHQSPMSKGRLSIHVELLQVLGDALLRENLRTRQYRQTAAIVESSDDAIISNDLDGTITSWNRGAERHFGYTAQETVGQLATMLMPLDQVDEESGILERIRHGESIEHYETVRRRKDGTLLDISLTVSPITDESGKIIIGASKIERDVTERKQAEEALREANARLADQAGELERLVAERTAALRETIGELEAFSYSVSHDMRAPLRAMRGFADVLVEENAARLDARGVDYLNRISTAASRMDKLIEDVLSYACVLRSGLKLEPLDLGQLIREIIGSYPQLEASAADIQVEEGLPRVLGNEASLTQCVSNLLANALKFVTSGVRPKVRVWAEEKGADVRLWIEDNGIGIGPGDQERIFRIFERVVNRAAYDGTGIGLAIVRKAAERMGGRAGVESTPGQGSKFWIELPKDPS